MDEDAEDLGGPLNDFLSTVNDYHGLVLRSIDHAGMEDGEKARHQFAAGVFFGILNRTIPFSLIL